MLKVSDGRKVVGPRIQSVGSPMEKDARALPSVRASFTRFLDGVFKKLRNLCSGPPSWAHSAWGVSAAGRAFLELPSKSTQSHPFTLIMSIASTYAIELRPEDQLLGGVGGCNLGKGFALETL